VATSFISMLTPLFRSHCGVTHQRTQATNTRVDKLSITSNEIVSALRRAVVSDPSNVYLPFCGWMIWGCNLTMLENKVDLFAYIPLSLSLSLARALSLSLSLSFFLSLSPSPPHTFLLHPTAIIVPAPNNRPHHPIHSPQKAQAMLRPVATGVRVHLQ
jgi:hypothetical protein